MGNWTDKEKKRFEMLNLLTLKVITEKQAASELGLSIRHVRRLKKRFIQQGMTIESLLFHRTATK